MSRIDWIFLSCIDWNLLVPHWLNFTCPSLIELNLSYIDWILFVLHWLNLIKLQSLVNTNHAHCTRVPVQSCTTFTHKVCTLWYIGHTWLTVCTVHCTGCSYKHLIRSIKQRTTKIVSIGILKMWSIMWNLKIGGDIIEFLYFSK